MGIKKDQVRSVRKNSLDIVLQMIYRIFFYNAKKLVKVRLGPGVPASTLAACTT